MGCYILLRDYGAYNSLFLPSTLRDVWGNKSPRVCREVNGMRLVRRSLHCSVGGETVSRRRKTENVTIKAKDPLTFSSSPPRGEASVGMIH